jgi:7-cyano-7-deazaguanine synthase
MSTNGDKFTILKDADEAIKTLGLDFDTIFANTCTSYAPDTEGRSHGETGSDVERILAFHQFGRPDPIQYTQPWQTVLARALELEEEQKRQQ